MDWKAYLNNTKNQIRNLNKAIPETASGFQTLSAAVKDSGVLDVKTKELIALGIAIADRCTDCIGFHVSALSRAGGTREEVADVVAMAIQMGGGPALMYGAKALDAWDQLVENS
jgi:AhpD family alkylhydroperoxidase